MEPKNGDGWKMIFHFGSDFSDSQPLTLGGGVPLGNLWPAGSHFGVFFVLVLTKKQPLYIPRNP